MRPDPVAGPPIPGSHDWSVRTQPADLPEIMDGPCTPEELRRCLHDLARVNRRLFGYRPILNWLASLDLPCEGEAAQIQPVRILDIGCGGGDTLRRIESWAAHNHIPVELIGIDLNPETIDIAREATAPGSEIQWIAADVFTYQPPQRQHLIVSSLMTHHLPDAQIVEFLQWLEATAEWGWAINDLSRNPTPARLFGWFASLAGLHPFVRHDGPVSFARAFVAADWQRYCKAAGLPSGQVEIRGFTPGRLLVSRSKVENGRNA